MTAAVPLVERLAEVLRGGWDAADALDAARALLPVVEQAVAEARGEAWDEGHAARRDYQGDGWNSDAHDPAETEESSDE